MRFSELALLADENIPTKLVNGLLERDCVVSTTKQLGLDGKPDTDVLAWAFANNRAVLTQDKDFGTMAFNQRIPFFGIVYIRPGHIDSNVAITTLTAIESAALDYLPPFVLVAENTGQETRIRLRNQIDNS